MSIKYSGWYFIGNRRVNLKIDDLYYDQTLKFKCLKKMKGTRAISNKSVCASLNKKQFWDLLSRTKKKKGDSGFT